MTVKILPDVEVLRQLFMYDEKTGNIYWESRDISMFVDERSFNTFHSQFAGKKAGSLKAKEHTNYIEVCIFGRTTLAHRVIWKMHYGTEPPPIIDHIDGDGTNNKIENLREATIHQNGWNSKKNVRNKSGFKGVSFNTEQQRWRAAIHVKGKTRLLGYFNTPEEAGDAYKNASIKLHGSFSRI
jgi:hypothetical protein